MSAQDCIAGGQSGSPTRHLPDWVPAGVHLYLSHTAHGRSLRALARDHGCHASTVMRQVRRFESRRDDPLVDNALRKLDRALRPPAQSLSQSESAKMMSRMATRQDPQIVSSIENEGLKCLAHLVRGEALLIVAPDMAKAVVTREDADGVPQRVAVVDRAVAEAMALRDWIICRRKGRVLSYGISPAGRAELRAARMEPDTSDDGKGGQTRRIRYGTAESPVTVLARRRDKTGAPFLAPELVHAAERMREDFVMAQLDRIEAPLAQDILAALEKKTIPGPNIAPAGTKAARERIRDVLRDLGPGLGDMAVRCCCRLEGVESAETALGWSARSGKIVLRIALERLSRHYRQLGDAHLMIG